MPFSLMPRRIDKSWLSLVIMVRDVRMLAAFMPPDAAWAGRQIYAHSAIFHFDAEA